VSIRVIRVIRVEWLFGLHRAADAAPLADV
jgi:hypothetical protein